MTPHKAKVPSKVPQQAEVPERERWLWDNPEALAAVREGIQQARHGKVSRLDEDFTKYADDDLED